MKKITKRILGCICMSPVIVGLSYAIYKLVLLAMYDPKPIFHVLGAYGIIFGAVALFALGFHLISK